MAIKKYSVFFVFILFLFNIACGPSPKSARIYNLRILKLQKELLDENLKVEKAFRTFNTAKIRKALMSAENLAIKNLKILRTKIGYLYGDSLLYNATVLFFRRYIKVFRNEYRQMYKIYCIPIESYNLNKEIEFNDIQNKKNQILKIAYKNFMLKQYKFSDKYLVTVR